MIFLFQNLEPILIYWFFRFITIVAGIMIDNRSNTTKRAMSLLSVQGPSEIIVQFTSMIQYQISNYARYGLTSSQLVMELWTKVMCIIWKEAETDLFVYVLDTVFRNVFHSQTLQWARELLINLITVSVVVEKFHKILIFNCFRILVVPKKMLQLLGQSLILCFKVQINDHFYCLNIQLYYIIVHIMLFWH